jgi:uncharacterized protein YdeI (BOF family)
MRTLLLMSLLVTVGTASAADQVIRLSEPVETTPTHETFGAPMPETGAVSLSDAVAGMAEAAEEPVVIETEVVQVCQKKGCFFIARDGETTARVKFEDYGFFIPTDSAGKTVTLAGTLQRIELSPEQAAHYASDAGEDPAAAEPGFEYRVTASSVRIPRS